MGQISFDELLAGDNETIPSSPMAPPFSPLHEKVREMVLEGVSSAIEICEMLISSGAISKERYSTGKPVAYGKVCIILEELVKTGLIEFVEDLNKTDRIYHLK